MRSLIILTAFALPLIAQQPQVQNGSLSLEPPLTLSAEVARLQASSGTTWLAYTVPSRTRIEQNNDAVTYLEGESRGVYSDRREPGAPPYRALVLMRISNHALTTIRPANPDRKLDAGGTRIAYLASVHPAQSVAFLQGAAEHTTSTSLRDEAILTLSLHQSPATVPALADLAAPSHDFSLREKALFWLSTQCGAEALPVLDRYARQDKDDRLREKITFDLSLIHQPAAADLLIRMAHQDSALQVRRQAQFWMAQIAGKRMAADLVDSAETDPEESIRKSAVFSLSQLPNGEGTSRLIDLVKTSKDPGVRKQAIFWLGQSNDPRALEYLTQWMRQ